MSKALKRVWIDIEEGDTDDVPRYILEYIKYYGCDDDEITDMVHRYFQRLDEEG